MKHKQTLYEWLPQTYVEAVKKNPQICNSYLGDITLSEMDALSDIIPLELIRLLIRAVIIKEVIL
jgi:hypothetical protein